MLPNYNLILIYRKLSSIFMPSLLELEKYRRTIMSNLIRTNLTRYQMMNLLIW